jgi:flagellar protein FlgJ
MNPIGATGEKNSGGANPVRVKMDPAREKELRQAATRFESIVIGMMVKEMWKTIPKSGFPDRAPGMGIAEEMYQRELSRDLARSGGLGVAREIISNMSGMAGTGKAIDEMSGQDESPVPVDAGKVGDSFNTVA